MVCHAVEIGWTPVAVREREAGMLFRAEVEEALGRFNLWMSAGAALQPEGGTHPAATRHPSKEGIFREERLEYLMAR